MKTLKRISVAIIVFVLGFILYTLISTGFFRVVEPMLHGEIIKKVAVKGAEDITVSISDSFVLISATDRANISEINKDGGLYMIDLKSNNFVPQLLTKSLSFDFEPHGISYFKKDSTYHIMAINHANEEHSIELFELSKNELVHKRTLKDPSMIQPNDLVMLDENRFYFTNDHRYTEGIGKVMEEFLGLAVSNVIYYDGEDFKEAAKGIAYANGINFDKKRKLIYVSSPRDFSVKVYSKLEDGSLSFIEDIACGTGVDNIELDENSDLWVGCHPNLLKFNAYRNNKEVKAPSEVIKITYKNRGDYSVEKIYIEDGTEMSASTVAATYKDLVFVGNVMDEKFLILKLN